MKVVLLSVILALSLAVFPVLGCSRADNAPTPAGSPERTSSAQALPLPAPRLESEVSLEESLLLRRSVREYSEATLALDEVSQLLWAAQGITSEWGGRTAPSAGGLYPLEVYLVSGSVEGLSPGVYRYRPRGHGLEPVRDGDRRGELAVAALNQDAVRAGAVDIVITAVYERTTGKYGERGTRYVHMEAGHAAQNICLQAAALDLGAVTIGAFFDEAVRGILGAPEEEAPLYIIPVGRKS